MEEECQKSGAHLASVHSEEENRILFQLLKANHDAFKGNETKVLAFIGSSAIGVDGQSFHGKNTDDSAFDFGDPTDSKGAPIKGRFSWRPDYPAFLGDKKYPALISDNAFKWSGFGYWKFFNQPVRCGVCKKRVQEKSTWGR
ncbi:hypothetical protein AAVH_23209 [Aphelenchoides avenae]|nr:hypothetical protein AAVH_23209 [Aphelenchus avenae]